MGEALAEYEGYDGVGLAELVSSGRVDAETLLRAAIERVERHNPTLNAVVIPMLDEARATLAAGAPTGPFCGVPFLLKDLHAHYAGVRTTNGSQLFADFVPDHDSEITARYKRAGLVIFGKSASPEFGLTTTTESRLFGQTRNPWNHARTAGGSSGGAAAAVCAGILPCANASDGGGSIRIPASCCGLFGLKPTRARTPMGPDVGEGWSGMSCVHAVTRTVRDSAALLDATQGPDLGAPYCAPAPERTFLEEAGAAPPRLRIALQTASFNGAPTHPDCAAAAEDAAALCRDLGHDVEPALLSVDATALGEAARVLIAANLRAALEDRARELGRELEREDVELVTYLMTQSVAAVSAADYARAIRTIHAAGRRVAAFLADYDVILTPTMATPPLPLGPLSLSNEDFQEFVSSISATTGFTQLFNASGCPAMSVPLHWNAEELPIGVQFGGRFGDEATLLRLAGQLEQARPWFDRRPPAV